MKTTSPSLEATRKRLFFVPILGLRKFASAHGLSSAKSNSADKKSLIKWLIRQRNISLDALDQLFFDYSYGRRVSLVVYKFGLNVKIAELPQRVMAISTEKRPETNRHIFDLQFIEIQEVSQCFEIPFRFSRKRFYLSADTEESEKIHELNFGVAWIEKHGRYLALLCKDDYAIDLVIEVLKTEFSSNLVRIALPKEIVNEVFDITKSRRQVYTSDDNITRSYSGEKVYGKVPNEIASREAADHRSSSLYTDEIGSCKSATFGVTSRKGKLYIQNHVSKTDLQNWSQDIIDQLLEALEKLSKNNPQAGFEAIQGSLTYGGIRKTRIEAVGEFIKQVIQAYQSGSEIQLQREEKLISLLNDSDYFIKMLFPYCDGCQSDEFCQCKECDSALEATDIDSGECPNCHSQHNGIVNCVNGHSIQIEDQIEPHLFSPRHNLLSAIKEAFGTLGFDLSYAERIRVLGGLLKVSAFPFDVIGEVKFDEIAEFTSIPNFSGLSHKHVDVEALADWVRQLDEKCKNGVTKDDCAKCLLQPVSGLCLMRIWHPCLPGYLPQPHGPTELGDIHANITIKGKQRQMIGIIKRRDKRVRGLLGHKQTSGKEILRQTVTQFIRDTRVSVLAVVVPHDIEPQFKADLAHLVRLVGKQITFWSTNELARVAYASASDIIKKGHPLSWYRN